MAKYLPERKKAEKSSPIVIFGTSILILLFIYLGFYLYYVLHQKTTVEPASMVLTVADLPPIIYKKGYGDPQPLERGAEIHEQDRIVSVKRPRTVFILEDKHTLRMGPNTQILIDKLKKTKDKNYYLMKVALQKGRIWIDRVRGLTIEVDAGRLLVSPYGNRIEVRKGHFQELHVISWQGKTGVKPKTKGSAEEFIVEQGQHVVFTPGQKPRVESIDADRMDTWEGWNLWNTNRKIASGLTTDEKMGYLLAREKLEASGLEAFSGSSEEGGSTAEAPMFCPPDKMPTDIQIEVKVTNTPGANLETTRTGYISTKQLSTSGIDRIPDDYISPSYESVNNIEQLRNIKIEVVELMEKKFSMVLQHPLRVELTSLDGVLSSYEYKNETHQIFVVPGLPEDKTFGIVSFWSAYAWFLENAQNTTDYKYNCGFSSWVAYKLSYEKKYYSFCKELLNAPDIGRMLNFLIQNIELKNGEKGIFDYCVMEKES